jgi:hypothetical protein
VFGGGEGDGKRWMREEEKEEEEEKKEKEEEGGGGCVLCRSMKLTTQR